MNQIKKAVFPVAGFGSRFLPATKANPKEMLPIVDKPLIQYAVEEAVRAGITHMIFITSSTKRAIEDHFDNNFELETRLRDQGKEKLLALVEHVSPPGIQFTYVRQHHPLGLGHAVLCAEHVVGQEPFAVLLADDIIDDHQKPCLRDMLECYRQDARSVIAVQGVDWQEVERYGVVKMTDASKSYASIDSMIEKPARDEAPSNLVAVGRYVFTSRIFDCLRNTSKDKAGEIQLTNAIQQLLQQETVYAYQYCGRRYDCGSKLGYLQATVELGMQHPEVGAAFRAYLKHSLEIDEVLS